MRDLVFGSRVLLVVVWSSVATASPRVVVADEDGQLRAAVAEALRPWRIDVVNAPAPADRDTAAAEARTLDARYVIWRDGADLVVYDRDRDRLDHRSVRAGAIDQVGAAAIALSIKTILRLPPIEEPRPVVTTVAPLPPPSEEPLELRVTASAGSRFEYGLDGNIALRFGATIAVRPWHDRDWRFAVIGDAGAPAGVDQAGFHGQWWNWSALVGASWDRRIGDWEIGPRLALGIEHSSLTGTERATSRREEALLPALRGGVAVRRVFGSVSIGGELSVETLLGRDTYTAPDGITQVFEIPPVGAVVSLVIGADIAP